MLSQRLGRARRFLPNFMLRSTVVNSDSTRQIEVTTRPDSSRISQSPVQATTLAQAQTPSHPPEYEEGIPDPLPQYGGDSPPEYPLELLTLDTPHSIRLWYATSEERQDLITWNMEGDADLDLPVMSQQDAEAEADRWIEIYLVQRAELAAAPMHLPNNLDAHDPPALSELEQAVETNHDDWMRWLASDNRRNMIHEGIFDGQTPAQAEATVDDYHRAVVEVAAYRNLLGTEQTWPTSSSSATSVEVEVYHDILREQMRLGGMSSSQVEDYMDALRLEDQQGEDRAMMPNI